MDFLSQNALYVVLLIVLVVWFGILGYLFTIERRIRHMEQQWKKQ
jgi:CcmD family protein